MEWIKRIKEKICSMTMFWAWLLFIWLCSGSLAQANVMIENGIDPFSIFNELFLIVFFPIVAAVVALQGWRKRRKIYYILAVVLTLLPVLVAVQSIRLKGIGRDMQRMRKIYAVAQEGYYVENDTYADDVRKLAGQLPGQDELPPRIRIHIIEADNSKYKMEIIHPHFGKVLHHESEGYVEWIPKRE